MMPSYRDMVLLGSSEPPNPSRLQALFLGCVMGPFNWPDLLIEFGVMPFLGQFCNPFWSGMRLLLLKRILAQVAIGTALGVFMFPLMGVMGRVRLITDEERKAR